MPDLLSSPERKQLMRLEDLLEEWLAQLQKDLESAADHSKEPGSPIDLDYMNRWVETAQRLSSQVHKEIPPDLDLESLAELRGHIIEGLAATYELDESRPLDSVDNFMVHAEAVRHIIRDALDGQPAGDESDAKALLVDLSEKLPRVSRKELAKLIALSERQMQRVVKDGGRPSRRLQLVARLVALLWRAWTPEGVIAWFYRERPDLDGHPPIDVLDKPDYERALMLAARRGRAQHGS